MSDVAENLAAIRARIAEAMSRREVDAGAVELIAVSKTFPPELILEAANAGQRVFGESKLQEAEPKISMLLPSQLSWHFIGRVQRNKVRKLISSFQVLHGIDSQRLAAHVDGVAAETGKRPEIFLQVNLSDEVSKGGFKTADLKKEMGSLLLLDHLRILGLMTIPPACGDAEGSRPWFRQLREFRDELEQEWGIQLPSLSMGMSADFEVAVEEGATHVRVGTAVFGNRSHQADGELS